MRLWTNCKRFESLVAGREQSHDPCQTLPREARLTIGKQYVQFLWLIPIRLDETGNGSDGTLSRRQFLAQPKHRFERVAHCLKIRHLPDECSSGNLMHVCPLQPQFLNSQFCSKVLD